MHRFSKILSHSSGRRKSLADVSSSSSTSSSRRAAKPKRLERSYAVKNVNYEFTPCDSSSSSLFSQDESLLGGSYGGKTSFRVDGTEGEFEIICKTFGFSGIEDFAISPEEYEEMKLKSPSADVVVSKVFKPINYEKPEIDCDDIEAHDVINRKMEGFEICDVVCREFGGSRDLGCNDRRRGVTELSNRLEDGLRINSVTSNDKRVSSRTSVNRRNGIKGMQPTVLLVNKEYSNWDAAGGFEMDSDTFVSGFQSGFSLDEDKEGTEEVGQKHSEKEMDMALRVANFVPSETSSFTSNDDDDSSSTVTEPMSSSSERYRYVIEDWQKGELLGRGSFGSVYEGIADDGFFFAVKEVSLLDQGNDAKQCIIQLEQEIALLSQFEHENIVRYYGTKKVESHLYIFLELVTKGSLMSLYQKYELRGPIAAAYTRQILLGLKYLHDRNVIHRDIKCANILVHTNGLVKLTDFGLAKAAKLNDVKSCKGTVFWMAPEVVRSQGYGLAADIWSLGCTVLEMLTRRFPYHDLEYMSALYRIGQGERPHIPDSLSRDARSFILECLQVDPYLRPTAAQLLDHPFVKRPLTSSSSMYSPQSFIRQI